jgi:hypothetical protein
LLLPWGEFSAYPFPYLNRNREIAVTNPEDPYGDPLYTGPAKDAANVLTPGAYWYEYTDEVEEWDI